jgi:polysaccharide biosynthesis/export protein
MRFNSMKCTFGSLTLAIILAVGITPFGAEAQSGAPDKKLVQYVRDAKTSGQKQSQAQEAAIKAGWPPAAVSDAVAYIYGASNSTPDSGAHTDASWTAKTQTEPAALGGSPTAGSDAKIRNPNGVAPGSMATGPDSAAPVGSAPVAVPHLPYEYRIGAGDALHISVWKEPEASGAVVVRPDGMISTPLIKEIQVAGLTPTEAQNLITEKLVKLIQEPDVTVVVTGMGSKKVYAIGGVKKEGPIPYTYSMTVMQAISEAGGLSDYAKRKKIYVLRNENGKEIRFPFNYDEVLKGNHMELNILMLPGDTLVVPH